VATESCELPPGFWSFILIAFEYSVQKLKTKYQVDKTDTEKEQGQVTRKNENIKQLDLV
jgi:hypothetical protein